MNFFNTPPVSSYFGGLIGRFCRSRSSPARFSPSFPMRQASSRRRENSKALNLFIGCRARDFPIIRPLYVLGTNLVHSLHTRPTNPMRPRRTRYHTGSTTVCHRETSVSLKILNLPYSVENHLFSTVFIFRSPRRASQSRTSFIKSIRAFPRLICGGRGGAGRGSLKFTQRPRPASTLLFEVSRPQAALLLPRDRALIAPNVFTAKFETVPF
ncbi:hypothetical protein EVAR_24754_1 [Eumeta japonica]|uniref:Uncharacterized protein n=1 Tax=Eumeta variegata TaxID=151549 RepID=A0A4C1VD26_EUMVA|nr:hypothetical protein EVAR_24754_1 [Eumeta japonica]